MGARWDKRDVLLVGLCSALLIGLSRRFDFFCDDAFITLRYAHNLATHGAPVYNLGEKVEGYTSLAWLALASLGVHLPVALTAFVQGLGALSGVGLVAASSLLLRRVLPGERAYCSVALLMLVVCAPVAAWTSG